jgi:NADPH:quinone reductase
VKALVFSEPGGVDVLRVEDVADPTPGPGHVLVRTHASGVNFSDILVRRGDAPAPSHILGLEGAGTVVAVGDGVDDAIVTGDRVAWPMALSSHAELVAVPAAMAVPLPDDVEFDTAAAIIAQGLTAQYLVSDTYPLDSGHVVLIHAGSTGVGRLLVQFARHCGAKVFATTSSEAKFDAVRDAGAHEVFTYDGFADKVRALTDGAGADVVYDGVGAATFEHSVQAVRRRGTVVLYGAASGYAEPFDLMMLRATSAYVTVPIFANYVTSRDELLTRSAQVFSLLKAGVLTPSIGGRFEYADAALAHSQLEGRAVLGKLILVPPGL